MKEKELGFFDRDDIGKCIFSYLTPVDNNYFSLMFTSKRFHQLATETRKELWDNFSKLKSERQLMILIKIYSIFDKLPIRHQIFYLEKLEKIHSEKKLELRNHIIALMILDSSNFQSEKYQQFHKEINLLIKPKNTSNLSVFLLSAIKAHIVNHKDKHSNLEITEVYEFIYTDWSSLRYDQLQLFFAILNKIVDRKPNKFMSSISDFLRVQIRIFSRIKTNDLKNISYARDEIVNILSKVMKESFEYLNVKFYLSDKKTQILKFQLLFLADLKRNDLEIDMLEPRISLFLFIALNEDPLIYDNFTRGWKTMSPQLIEIALKQIENLFQKAPRPLSVLSLLNKIHPLLSPDQLSRFYPTLINLLTSSEFNISYCACNVLSNLINRLPLTIFSIQDLSLLFKHSKRYNDVEEDNLYASFNIWHSLWKKFSNEQIDELLSIELPRIFNTRKDEDKLNLLQFICDLSLHHKLTPEQMPKISQFCSSYKEFPNYNKILLPMIDIYAQDQTGQMDSLIVELINHWVATYQIKYNENSSLQYEILRKLVSHLYEKFFSNSMTDSTLKVQESFKQLDHFEIFRLEPRFFYLLSENEKNQLIENILLMNKGNCLENIPEIWSSLSKLQSGLILTKSREVLGSVTPWKERVKYWLALRGSAPFMNKKEIMQVAPILFKCMQINDNKCMEIKVNRNRDDDPWIFLILTKIYSKMTSDYQEKILSHVIDHYKEWIDEYASAFLESIKSENAKTELKFKL